MLEIVNNPLFVYLLILIASLYVLIRAADLIVLGISSYARKFGISEYLVGFLVIAVGMSTPEFVSSLMGSFQGDGGIVIGSFFGAVITSLLFVLGVAAIFGKKVSLESRLLSETRHFFLAIAAIPVVFLLFGGIPRWGGLVLVMTFAAYIIFLWKKEGTLGSLKNAKLKNIWKDAFIFLGALVALLLAARWMVFSAVQVADSIGISTYLVALIVVGFGASLPDLTVQIRAIKTGHTHIAFGDVLGSTLVDMLLFIGIIALINPIFIPVKSIVISSIFYLGGLALVLWLVKNKEMDYKHGIIMVCLYFLFIGLEILSEIGII